MLSATPALPSESLHPEETENKAARVCGESGGDRKGRDGRGATLDR